MKRIFLITSYILISLMFSSCSCNINTECNEPFYVVSFNSKGGEEISSQTLLYEEKVIRPKNPTKDGYTFRYWGITDSDDSERFDFNESVRKSLTLYAIWVDENYYTPGLKFWLRNSGTIYEIMRIDGAINEDEIIIPKTYDNLPVEGISSLANGKFRYVTMPDSIRIIRARAFLDCINLKEIILPEKLEELEEEAFSNCLSLSKAVFSKNLKIISNNAFSDCLNLSEVILPQELEIICVKAFSNCLSLSKVLLPQSLKIIEYKAFSNCDSLIEITLPDNLQEIGQNIFSECDNLEKVVLPNAKYGLYIDFGCPIGLEFQEETLIVSFSYLLATNYSFKDFIINENNSYYCNFEGNLYSKDMSTLILFGNKEDRSKFIIPKGVIYIDNYAFSKCQLSEIVVASSVKEISGAAFYSCNNIESIFIPITVELVETDAFNYWNENQTIYFEGRNRPPQSWMNPWYNQWFSGGNAKIIWNA